MPCMSMTNVYDPPQLYHNSTTMSFILPPSAYLHYHSHHRPKYIRRQQVKRGVSRRSRTQTQLARQKQTSTAACITALEHRAKHYFPSSCLPGNASSIEAPSDKLQYKIRGNRPWSPLQYPPRPPVRTSPHTRASHASNAADPNGVLPVSK